MRPGEEPTEIFYVIPWRRHFRPGKWKKGKVQDVNLNGKIYFTVDSFNEVKHMLTEIKLSQYQHQYAINIVLETLSSLLLMIARQQ